MRMVELRRIPQGGMFLIPGDETHYARGPYYRSEKTFIVRHILSYTHYHFPADSLVYPATKAAEKLRAELDIW